MFFSESIVDELKLAADDRSDKMFLLTLKLCSLGAVCPRTIYIYCIMNKTV